MRREREGVGGEGEDSEGWVRRRKDNREKLFFILRGASLLSDESDQVWEGTLSCAIVPGCGECK